MTTEGVVGRDAELAVLDELFRDIRLHGRVVLLRGEAGIGKSELMRLGRESAARRGLRVLRATGVEGEMTLPFAGLHQLIQPMLGGLSTLPAPPAARADGGLRHDG
ncbi:ATP-binding protein [Nocardioides anomalus]|uniref:ATP-binding protein n=1 Tax=Nocardioides anomalus TaxID=2712223 RepID=A0A6G6WFA6_9ACTN|nr:ATP-binding protein [Nocardioides anomalus]QIG43914.1 ATP-binding protein [Nocardioides anomalus]